MSFSIALANQQGQHVGFLLMAGIERDFRTKSGEWQGQCVFMALPTAPELFSDPAYLALAERKQCGEHTLQVNNDGQTVKLVASDDQSERFYATLHRDGQGEWGAIQNGSSANLGRAVFAK